MTKFKVFIKQADSDFFDDWAFAAYVGFKNRGFIKNETLLFYEDIMEVPAQKTNIVVGPIEDTIKFFERVGVEVPKPLNIPDALNQDAFLNAVNSNFKRYLNVVALGYLRKLSEERLNIFPLFIKSNKELKLFPSGVVKDQFDFNVVTKDIEDDVEVLISQVIDFKSEYRCFVNKGNLVGIKHYLGDFTIFPNIKFVECCIAEYINSPVSYTIDFGIDDKGETHLIECNDAWAIGHYGLDEKVYTTLLVDRWMEIMFGINKS